MSAKSPEEICRLFKQFMVEGDVDSLLNLYDQEAVFLNEAGELKKREELRQILMPMAAAKTVFDFDIRQVIQSGDIALMHTDWKILAPKEMLQYAIEVARRQPDGSWCWLIGDPFSIGKRIKS